MKLHLKLASVKFTHKREQEITSRINKLKNKNKSCNSKKEIVIALGHRLKLTLYLIMMKTYYFNSLKLSIFNSNKFLKLEIHLKKNIELCLNQKFKYTIKQR